MIKLLLLLLLLWVDRQCQIRIVWWLWYYFIFMTKQDMTLRIFPKCFSLKKIFLASFCLLSRPSSCFSLDMFLSGKIIPTGLYVIREGRESSTTWRFFIFLLIGVVRSFQNFKNAFKIQTRTANTLLVSHQLKNRIYNRSRTQNEYSFVRGR